jgi:hypothetical protein
MGNVCDAAEQAATLERANVESPEGKEEAVKAVEVLGVISQARTRELQALTPPPGDKAEISKILANRNEELAHLRRLRKPSRRPAPRRRVKPWKSSRVTAQNTARWCRVTVSPGAVRRDPSTILTL